MRVRMHTYHLSGTVTLNQYCHVRYPEKTGLPVLTTCDSREDCEGHEIVVSHEEDCEGRDLDDAIGNWSLTKFERLGDLKGAGDGLEPTWLKVEGQRNA